MTCSSNNCNQPTLPQPLYWVQVRTLTRPLQNYLSFFSDNQMWICFTFLDHNLFLFDFLCCITCLCFAFSSWTDEQTVSKNNHFIQGSEITHCHRCAKKIRKGQILYHGMAQLFANVWALRTHFVTFLSERT